MLFFLSKRIISAAQKGGWAKGADCPWPQKTQFNRGPHLKTVVYEWGAIKPNFDQGHQKSLGDPVDNHHAMNINKTVCEHQTLVVNIRH